MEKRSLARHTCAVCAAIGLTFAVAGPVYAAPNLVTNGGFESGVGFDGWTYTPGNAFASDQQICPGPSPEVLQGNCSAAFSTLGAASSLSQNLSLVPGTFYDVSFGVNAPFADDPSTFLATLDGQTLLNLLNPVSTGGTYHLFTARHRALASTEALVFTVRDDPGNIFLDAVSVTVPEPASLALLGIGLAGVAASRRRKPS